MATITFDELDNLAGRLQAGLENLANLLKLSIARFVFMEVVERSPVGPAIGDPHPGLFRASNVVAIGAPNTARLPTKSASYPIPGAAEFDAGVAGVTYAIPIFLDNNAWGGDEPAGWVIERGRVWRPLGGRQAGGLVAARRRATGNYNLHRSINRRQLGRWYGSLQAPNGVYGPAILAVWAQRARVVAAALAELERLV